MAMNRLKSFLFPLFLTTLLLLISSNSIRSEARRLLEETNPEHLHDQPELPLPQLPHDLPSLPMPELPKVELPPLPEIPKPELPTLPKFPELPKPELPKLPELPHELPELTHSKLPNTGANNS